MRLDTKGPASSDAAAPPVPQGLWIGALHIYVAFDWGEEIDQEAAAKLVQSARSAVQALGRQGAEQELATQVVAPTEVLPRRRRTPTSFAYQPPPLRFRIDAGKFHLPEIAAIPTTADVTIFDFAAG